MAHINFIEFRTRDGMMALQRADQISTILETVVAPKGKQPITVLYLLLQNNNRIEIVGETRASLFDRLYACGGTMPVVIHKIEEPEDVPEAAE
jgi:hypothetical protein